LFGKTTNLDAKTHLVPVLVSEGANDFVQIIQIFSVDGYIV